MHGTDTAIHGPTPPRRRFPWWRRLLVLALLALVARLTYPLYEPVVTRMIFSARLMRAPAPEALPLPVQGARARDLRDSWHAVRPGGRQHEGIDIFAPRGREVVSTTDGIVSRIASTPIGGNVVWVMGPGRQFHYYAHLDRHADIRVGDIVRAGGVLGYIGNTGNAKGTPPHLHYGIYAAREAINPYPLLKRR